MTSIAVTPTSVTVGGSFAITGSGFGSRRTVSVYSNGAFVFSFRATRSGTFSRTMTSEPPTGPHVIKATDTLGNTASATVTVNAVAVDPPPPSGTYTFEDNFASLNTSMWIEHYHCCGVLAGFDPVLTFVSGGYLNLTVENRSGGWWAYPVDTKTTFTQKYGIFEARIKIPKGKGLWPAFWGYYDANEAEIDAMEVCANPIGANGGVDASLLHTHVHWANGGDIGKATRSVDLSLDFHVYGVEWRADHIAWFLDGVEVWRFTDTTHIPTVPLPLILNLGIGGSWCGSPDATTPSPSTMLVDWVRVSA